MKKTKVNTGDEALYERLKTGVVSAVNGNSGAGNGWRPVSNGMFLGNKCYGTENKAIEEGRNFIFKLKNRVTAKQRKPNKVTLLKTEVAND